MASTWKEQCGNIVRLLQRAHSFCFINGIFLSILFIGGVEAADNDGVGNRKQSIVNKIPGIETVKMVKVVLLSPGFSSRGSITIGMLFGKGCWYSTESQQRILELLDVMNANLNADEESRRFSWEPREGIVLKFENELELTFLFSYRYSDGTVKGYSSYSGNTMYVISRSAFLDALTAFAVKIGPSPQGQSTDLQTRRMCSGIGR